MSIYFRSKFFKYSFTFFYIINYISNIFSISMKYRSNTFFSTLLLYFYSYTLSYIISNKIFFFYFSYTRPSNSSSTNNLYFKSTFSSLPLVISLYENLSCPNCFLVIFILKILFNIVLSVSTVF